MGCSSSPDCNKGTPLSTCSSNRLTRIGKPVWPFWYYPKSECSYRVRWPYPSPRCQ
ncbi:hypothetical protein WG66_010573 [Moniliophthora roreri]|nr:hypothetical protein WG66_010573 [Moniliophthora roreri]